MIVPLTLPGIAAGALLVFIPAVGEFVIPDLLGGPDTLMIGKLLWQEFFDNVDWPAASAIAVALVAVLTLPLLLGAALSRRRATRHERRSRPGGVRGPARSPSGFGFLYLPIAVLIAYSFNGSRLVTIWGGFSTRWYGALIEDEKFLARGADQPRDRGHGGEPRAGARHRAGLAMNRFGRFRGRAVFAFMLTGAAGRARGDPRPVAAAAVRRGQSCLGWPASRGMLTVTIAHATFAACFVAVLVRAQLAGFDRSLEEAALDLGARPWTVLWRITLPGISPALVSGWLLAFTMSLDDLVIASFVSGPAATTLPMAVYSSVRIGVTPEINALATVFLAVVFAIVASAFVLIARQEKRRRAASRRTSCRACPCLTGG